MEVLPCSRVAHIERTKKPYNNDIDYYAKRNALRAAEVWMDEFKSHVYMAWNIPMNVRNSKASGYCLDQGAEDDDKAILYPCHGMSSQVGALVTITQL
ncbi:Polypeptide N-acetylgalactosaminyltransferase 9 [Acipenser ruthenus]|uniref:Polypeptide N-acetylgalactosaminyltransferase 9 n=1 Tax=Acipenser ruthenus TaxID=7906 RepID=A0A444UAV7_ACIRT|nr:Polypeptide N-acetylgalactosaminyltransferase 9 [Acipenser ruthenus]